MILVSHDWAELVKVVQLQVTSRSLELKRELKTGGVSYLGAHGQIVAPHMLEVSTSWTNGLIFFFCYKVHNI